MTIAPEDYLGAIDFYEEHAAEDNLDQIIEEITDRFPPRVLEILYEQGFFFCPMQKN
jgi:hypothetical protein